MGPTPSRTGRIRGCGYEDRDIQPLPAQVDKTARAGSRQYKCDKEQGKMVDRRCEMLLARGPLSEIEEYQEYAIRREDDYAVLAEDLDPPVVRIYYARREVVRVGVGVCQDDGKIATSHSGAEAGGGHVDADLNEVEADQCRGLQNEGRYKSGVDGREE